MTAAKSIPAKDTTQVRTPSVSSDESLKAADTASPSESAETSAVAKKGLAFPMVVTILAVLPMALGVGTVRLKASASMAQNISNTVDVDHNCGCSNSSPDVTDRRLGDRDFLARRYEVALQYYQSLGNPDPTRLPPDLLYRIALCQEGLGWWTKALESLQGVIGAAENPVLRAASTFGQARIRLRMNESNQAVSLLRSLKCHSTDENALPANMTRDIEFLIPLAMANEAVLHQPNAGYGAPAAIGELLIWSLEAALDSADQPFLSERLAVDANAPSNVLACRLIRPTVPTDETTKAEMWNVEICSKGQPWKLLVQRLADECGWKLDWSDLSNDPSLDQVVDFISDAQTVAASLTNICSELQSTWSIDDDRLTMKHSDPEGNRARRMITLTLASLANRSPNHRLANHARFAMAELAQFDGHLSEAATIFSSLVGRESSPLAIHAAYDAAMIYYQSGDYTRARLQLGYVVDGAPGHELHTESLILLGRLLLDTGDAQAAVFHLRRATEAGNRPDLQARAAVLLGLAYLAQDRFQEAAEAIFTNKSYFDDPSVRNAAAFVTAFARWQSVQGDVKERESTFVYRSLIKLKTGTEWLGQTGQMLIGRAYLELGFDDLMAEFYSKILARGVTKNIESELNFSLANYEQANGRTETAVRMWNDLTTGTSELWANRTRLRLAEIQLGEGHAKECLQHCEFIKTDDGVARADVNKMRGRAYEQLGEDELAARCYAGLSPTP